MARTTATLVEALLGSDYNGTSDLDVFIASGNVVTTRVATCASSRGTPLTDTELELIERWLAAYYYTRTDPIYKSRRTADASATFGDRSYMDGALGIDTSGCLRAITSGQRASVFWGGKAPSDQTDYWSRD